MTTFYVYSQKKISRHFSSMSSVGTVESNSIEGALVLASSSNPHGKSHAVIVSRVKLKPGKLQRHSFANYRNVHPSREWGPGEREDHKRKIDSMMSR
jgi:hypothetical protein